MENKKIKSPIGTQPFEKQRTGGYGYVDMIKLIAILLPLAGFFFYFRYAAPYHIGFKEQMQMFVFSSSYIMSYFSKPAVLACLGGDFMTQFFFFKTGGAAVVTLSLATVWLLIYLTLKRFPAVTCHSKSPKATLYAVSLLPVIVEMMAIPGYYFTIALSVSFIIALSAFLIYTKIRGMPAVITGILMIPALYMIAGASVFLFVFLAIFYDMQHKRLRFVYRAVILGLATTVPPLVRHCYLLSFEQAFFYPYPGIKQGLSLVTLSLAVFLFVCFGNLKIKPLKPFLSFIVLVFVLITGLVKTRDRDQENLFGLMIEAYHENWDQVLLIAEKAKLKNPVATCYANIALSQNSLLGERLLDFYQPYSSGLVLPLSLNFNVLEIFTTNDIYFHLGDMDMALHAAVVGMISAPHKRSARMVERMAAINLAIDETAVANKYKRMLERTMFHKPKIHALPHRERGVFKENVIRNPSQIKITLELLAAGNPDNLPAVNYLLCYYLLNADIISFFNAYTSYFKIKNIPVPKVYAEALLIYFTVTKSTPEEMTTYHIQPEIIRTFGEYNRLFEQSKGNLAFMLEKYPDSYWLYYQLALKSREKK